MRFSDEQFVKENRAERIHEIVFTVIGDHIVALEVSYMKQNKEMVVAEEHFFKDWTPADPEALSEKVFRLGLYDDFLKISGTSTDDEVVNIQLITDTGKALTLNPFFSCPTDFEVKNKTINAGMKLSYLSGAFIRQEGMVKLRNLTFVLRNTIEDY